MLHVKKKEKPIIVEQVEITDLAAKGKAVAKIDDLVYFVENAVPGDVVDLQVTKKKARYREARPIHFHQYSDKRKEAKCKHFGTCGGCKWQMLDYNDQLFYKEKEVRENLQRIGKMELPEISPILPSKEIYYYRNKLEFTFSASAWLTREEIESGASFDRRALGFHLPRMFDKILDLDECHLQAEPSNAIRLACKEFALENDISFFKIRDQEGLLRNLMIRTSSTGEVMVVLILFYEDKEKRELLLNFLKDKFPEISSLQYIINPKKNDTFFDLKVDLFAGKDHIIEEMEGLQFRVGAKSFYQTNSAQAYELYKVARDFAKIEKDDLVYDLYTGTGTIASFVAKQAKHVVGIEYVDAAIVDAKINAELNELKNTSFFAGDIKDVMNDDFIQTNGQPGVIITDPPRVGMHQDVVMKILEINPKRIVYVSCNPATQARDLELMDAQYKVTAIQPVDMFPHTYHVENVVALERR